MPPYHYVVVTREGRRIRGVASGDTDADVVSRLEANGDIVLSTRLSILTGANAPLDSRGLLELTQSLAALLPAGLPLPEALETAARMADARTQEVIAAIKERIERGQSLAEALSSEKGKFPGYYIAMVVAGESAGELPAALEKLTSQLEHDERLRSRLLAAALYPLLLAVASAGSVIVLVGFVLPRFTMILESSGSQLPLLARMLMQVSQWTRQGATVAGVFVSLSMVATLWSGQTPKGALLKSRILHYVPVIGTLIRELAGARMARMLGILLEGGVPLSRAIESSTEAVADPLTHEAIRQLYEQVMRGEALSDALSESRYFPDLLTRFVALGERSGRLAEFLANAALYYEERFETRAAKVLSIAEPVVILGFGAIVGTVALALLQTVYGVNAGAMR